MGINMRVFSVTDDEIRSCIGKPQRVRDRLWGAEGSPGIDFAELWNHWKLIDFIIGQGSLVVKSNLIIDPGDSEEIHAIESGAVHPFAVKLSSMSVASLRERLDPKAVDDAGIWIAGTIDSVMPEVSSCYRELTELAKHAEARGNGLIFYRYEAL